MEAHDRKAMLALLLTPGIGQGLVRHMLGCFGSPSGAVNSSRCDWQQLPRVNAQRARVLHESLAKTLDEGDVDRELAIMAERGVSLLTYDDADYPTLLRHIPDPPVCLWIRGRLQEDDALSLAIVGSRRCSLYGREQAGRFGYQCAQAGLCIISGGAYGIDASAHRGAIQAGGRTLAVVGSGLARPYPKDHDSLFDELVDRGGAVISELPMTTPPQAENFPRRNRIISGLSLGVLVIEAALRSGALITARLCVEDHGRELMAVPGRIDSKTSEGCHKMIREGWAKLVTNAADVLDGLGEAGQLLKVGLTRSSGPCSEVSEADDLRTRSLTDSQRRIMEKLAENCTLDQLVAMTGLPVQQIQSELTMLEIRGLVVRESGLFKARRVMQPSR